METYGTSGRIRTGSRFLQVSPSFMAAMRRWSASLRMACTGTWTTESRRQLNRGNRVSPPRSLMNRVLSPFYFVVSAKLIADGVLRGAGSMGRFMAATFTDLILRVGP